MRLEALEALAKLFNNLWFEQIKRDITDSKVQAYLMVFEDAFPHLNHVIEFVRKSADVLTDGSPDREHWSRLQGEFESLRLLLGEEQVQHRPGPPARRQSSPVADTEVTDREKEALGAVDQGDIDALFVEATTEPAPAVDPAPNDIDTLFVEAGAPAVGLLEEDDADEEGESDDDDNDVGAGISDEEMTALLEADEDDEEDSGDGKAVAAEAEVEVDSEDEESISQDEIDALFG